MTIEQTKVAAIKLVNNLVKAGEEVRIEYSDIIYVGTNLKIYAGKLKSENSLYREARVDLCKLTIISGKDAQEIYDEVLKIGSLEIEQLLASQ